MIITIIGRETTTETEEEEEEEEKDDEESKTALMTVALFPLELQEEQKLRCAN